MEKTLSISACPNPNIMLYNRTIILLIDADYGIIIAIDIYIISMEEKKKNADR